MKIATDCEMVFEMPDITSDAMREAINLWMNLYYDAGLKCKCEIETGQRLPYTIVSGLNNACFGEYEYSIEGQGENEAFDFSMSQFDKNREMAFQSALTGGEAFVKPIPARDGFAFSVVERDAYVVFERDLEGRITSIGTCEKTDYGGHTYTLFEKRTVDERGYLTIENKLYRDTYGSSLGESVRLDSLPQYSKLNDIVTLPVPVFGLGLIPIKTPMKNCVDGSHDGVSVYAAASGEIICAYRHAARCSAEYETTEPRVIVSADAYRRDEKGRPIGVPRYIEALDGSPNDTGVTVYNPKPNQAELEARENQILRHIEDICGLRRGILSHVDTEDKTATEVLTTSGRYALTIKSFQRMWKETIDAAVRLLSILGPMYGYWQGEAPKVTVAWGNGVLYDEDKDFQRLINAVSMGYLRPEYITAWLLDKKIDVYDPKAMAEIQKHMPDMTALELQRTVYG